MTHDDSIETLVTVRDWLRFAVSRFNEAGLVYGHGTDSALDEAAFLILETLRLPVDELDPWLDARLTRKEREAIAHVIAERVSTRKPAPYLVNAAYIRGNRFFVDERTIVPRSYIAELIDRGLDGVIAEPDAIRRVLDLCTGGGSLAILAALSLPDTTVDAVDISPDALEVAARNVEEYGLGDRIELIRSDFFEALGGRRYDLILSNPPYVTEEAVAAFPPEYRAEPRLAHAGGRDGLDLVRRILAEACDHLEPEGTLIVEFGQGRDALQAEFPELPFLWLDTEDSEGEVFALPASALGAKPNPRRRRR